MHNMGMTWEVVFHDEFDEEFKALDEGLQDELLAHAILLKDFGPNLGRPTVDTLKRSKYPNMKELRFDWEKEVRRVLRLRSQAAGRPARRRRQGRCRSETALQETHRRCR